MCCIWVGDAVTDGYTLAILLAKSGCREEWTGVLMMVDEEWKKVGILRNDDVDTYWMAWGGGGRGLQ